VRINLINFVALAAFTVLCTTGCNKWRSCSVMAPDRTVVGVGTCKGDTFRSSSNGETLQCKIVNGSPTDCYQTTVHYRSKEGRAFVCNLDPKGVRSNCRSYDSIYCYKALKGDAIFRCKMDETGEIESHTCYDQTYPKSVDRSLLTIEETMPCEQWGGKP
jgi:hypothetical protein